MALYKTSSTTLGKRCISSINKTSPGPKAERTLANSPGLAIEGPVITCALVPISLAIIWAKVVLPKPGGPYKRTWSKDSFLFLAAPVYILRFSINSDCPIYSSNVWGLIDKPPCVSSSASSIDL